MRTSYQIGDLRISVVPCGPGSKLWEINIAGPKELLRFEGGCKRIALAKATILADMIRTHAMGER